MHPAQLTNSKIHNHAGRDPLPATSAVAVLGACVLPLPQRDIDKVTSPFLVPAEALLRLSSYPKILGWTDTPTMATSFQSLADLAEGIPVFGPQIPGA